MIIDVHNYIVTAEQEPVNPYNGEIFYLTLQALTMH